MVLLALMMATAAIATDMYLPAFPAIRTAFDASAQSVQFSLSVFLWGNAAGQLIFGPLSDRYGRRPVLLVGLAAYALASFGCALATDISGFLAYRLVQGAAAASGPVLVRALINDRLAREQAAQMLAVLTGMMAFAAMLSPIAGGWLVQHFSWHSIFYSIGAFGVLLLIAVAANTRETLPAEKRLTALGPGEIVRGYYEIGRQLRFWCYVAPPSLLFAGAFAYVVINSFLLIETLGIAEQYYGVTYASAAMFFVIGSFAGNRLVRRLGVERAIAFGLILAVGTALAAVAASTLFQLNLMLVVIPGIAVFFCTALILPAAMSAAVSLFPRRAGTASAVAGFTQLMAAAASSATAAFLVDETTLPLHLFTLGCCLCAALIWFTGRHVRHAARYED
jgi:DHA1 family bicyclomycin/chloramphenicol resistance-like MFS transporter